MIKLLMFRCFLFGRNGCLISHSHSLSPPKSTTIKVSALSKRLNPLSFTYFSYLRELQTFRQWYVVIEVDMTYIFKYRRLITQLLLSKCYQASSSMLVLFMENTVDA